MGSAHPDMRSNLLEQDNLKNKNTGEVSMNKEVRGGGPCAHAHESVYIFNSFNLICYACAPRQMQRF